MVCDGFSNLSGSGCCSIIATDYENLRKLPLRRILQIARAYAMNLMNLDRTTLVDINRLSIRCDGKISITLLDINSTSTFDEYIIWKAHAVSIRLLISEWLLREGGEYDTQIIDCIVYYIFNIGKATDATTMVNLIDGLDLELMMHFQM